MEQSNSELYWTGTLVHLVTCFNLLHLLQSVFCGPCSFSMYSMSPLKRNQGKPNLSFLRLAILAQNNTWWIIWWPSSHSKAEAWNCSHETAKLPAAYHFCLIHHSLHPYTSWTISLSIYQDPSRLFFHDGRGMSVECMPARPRKNALLKPKLSDTGGRYSFNSHELKGASETTDFNRYMIHVCI